MAIPATTATFPFQQQKLERAENRIRGVIDVDRLFSSLDRISTSTSRLEGAGVLFIDAEYNIVQLRKFDPHCQKYPVYLVLKEPSKPKDERTYATDLKVRERESKLFLEASTMLLSCSAAALSWIVVFGSAAAVPISGGSSAAVTYLSYGAATATSLQCANGVFRTAAEVASPDELDALDSEEWYRSASHALDLISLAGAGVAVGSAIKSAKLMKSSTGKSYREVLQGLNRQERKRLTEDIVRANHPGVSNTVLKAMIRSGTYPKRYAQVAIDQMLSLKIKDSVAASLSFGGSFASGAMRSLAVGLYESLEGGS